MILGLGVQAQELRPLSAFAEQAALPYLPTRCGSLYQAAMEWSGQERMGAETWEQTDVLRADFLTVAILAAQSESGGTVAEQTEIVLRDARNMADLYLARFEANYAATGQAFAEDELILADLDYCSAVYEAIR